ncbi:DUF2267 domain-containing protein [Desulfopila inferna]|uniref:DUF2267 domain-containing protein n=1 Tax=Desulfopila inferna TaxID=468528 RepID=UPI00196253C3|nr:DUF2267 domain-containing protein [Desulfopila inferna]MBM9605002.1 DUF2267 domain-containing protein [Desulfopila inferna]
MTELKASPVLDKMVQSAHIWVKDIMYELNLSDPDQAYHVLRTTLQALRDRLPPAEAVHLGAQLPTLIRGVYYEGWKIADKPLKIRKKEEFYEHISELYNAPLAVEQETAARAVFKLLYHHLSEGEVKKIKEITPVKLQELWPHKV